MTEPNDVIEKLRMEYPEDLNMPVLHTWEEIERDVARQDHYEFVSFSDRAKMELMQAQVRAMLLQAAQLKRIADALENIEESDSLAESVRIWGSMRD